MCPGWLRTAILLISASWVARIRLVVFWDTVSKTLRASCLLDRHSTTWATLPTLFCVGYFQDWISRTICPRLTLNHDPPDYRWATGAWLISIHFWWNWESLLHIHTHNIPQKKKQQQPKKTLFSTDCAQSLSCSDTGYWVLGKGQGKVETRKVCDSFHEEL
jgi:hypothetical protein